ncbi:tape measure protein [Gordonia phage VanLee]|uniref:Tape measure protein n=1 Tax=Gordonia phage VanLee TaxID=2845816 RepID=A0A8F2DA83_9CAUD|nr:tape measure protein [Gordonia phage VanLee]QWS68136.1 tape measure protein [Gordonia phage VanLee]
MATDGTIRIRIVPDTSGFQQTLDVELSRVRAKVSVHLEVANGAEFAYRVQMLCSSIRPTIRVRLEIDQSSLSRLLLLLQQISNIGGGNGGGGNTFNFIFRLTNVFKLFGSVVRIALFAVQALAVVSLIPLIASASQALGVFVLLPGAIFAAAAALGTLVTGFSGIGGAFSAAIAAQDELASGAQDLARTQRNAAEAVVRAQEGVLDAYRNQEAAQRNAEKAARDLNTAYRDQARELRDVNDQLQDSILATEDAAIGVARAKQNYARTVADRRMGRASALDVQEADLRVRQAQSRYNQQRKSTADTRQDVAEANRRGVGGSDRVQDARQALNDAQYGQVQASRQVRDAQFALRDAYEALADAIRGAGTAQDKFAQAMAKLSPNAQDFVSKVLSLRDAWKDLKFEVQDNLFDGLGDEVIELAETYLPILKTGLGEIATGFNNAFKYMSELLGREESAEDFRSILDNTAVFVEKFGKGLAELGRGFTIVAEVGSRFLPGFGEGFQNSMTRFADKMQELSDNGKLQEFLQGAIDKFSQLWRIGSDVVGIFKSIFGSSKESGDDMLDSIERTVDTWNKFLASPEGQEQLKKFFEDLTQTLKEIAEVIDVVAKAFKKLDEWLGDDSAVGGLLSGDGENWASLGLKGLESGAKNNPLGLAVQTGNNAFGWAGDKLGVGDWNKHYKDAEGNAITADGDAAYTAGVSWIPDVKKDSTLGKLVGIFTGDHEIDLDMSLPDWVRNTIDWISDKFNYFDDDHELKLDVLIPDWLQTWLDDTKLKFTNLGDTATRIGDDIEQRWDDVVDWFEGLPDRIGRATEGLWDGLKTSFKAAVQWIVQKWNSLKLELKIPGIEVGGKTLIEPRKLTLAVPQIPDVEGAAGAPPRRDGGPVASRDHRGVLHGPGTPRSDELLGLYRDTGTPAVWVSRAEKIMSESSRAGGNEKLQDAMNAGWVLPTGAVSDVLNLPKRNNGGTFSDYQTPPGITGGTTQLGNISGEGITTGIQQSMWDYIRSVFPHAVLSSATRTVMTEGHPDFHNAGQAIDLGGPIGPLQEIADHIASEFGSRLLELFWDPGPNMKNGQPTGAIGGHGDHIHWAMGQIVEMGKKVGDIANSPTDENGANTGESEGNDRPDTYGNEPGANRSPEDIANGPAGSNGGRGSQSDPTSWSELAGEAAKTATAGYVADTLGVFGIKDELPGVVRAGQIAWSELGGEEAQRRINPDGTINAPAETKAPPGSENDGGGQNTDGDDPPSNELPENRGAQLEGVGKLSSTSSREDIAKAIIGEGKRRGYTDEEIKAILSTAIQESNLQMQNSTVGDWNGIFQQDSSYPGRNDPNTNIAEFYNRLDAKRAQSKGDIWKDIFWLQQRPGEPNAETAFANGGQHYLTEIQSRQLEADQMFQAAVYDQGGWLKPNQAAVNLSNKPEPVLTGDQWGDVSELVNVLTTDGFKGMTDAISGASRSAIVGAVGAIPGAGPAAAGLVDTGLGAMQQINDTVERGVGIYNAMRSGGINAATAKMPPPTPPAAGDQVHFHGRDWREALQRKKISDAQDRALMQGSRG